MADKYLYNNAGRVTEKAAITTSAGAGDSGKIPGLDSSGRLDTTFMPVGIGADTVSVIASEALTAGDFVNVYNNSGTAGVRKADATTNGKVANGFVLANVSSSATATVYLSGQNTQLSSLTPGSRYYLATTAGTVSTTAPSASSNLVQKVGYSVSATSIDFQPEEVATLV